ncbi:hypothetical protein N2U02_004486 [Salmonella enterica]|nr:hypothetical protein [Salmonella enterica]
MEVIKKLKEAGEPTECAPLALCQAVQNELEIWRHTSPEQMQERLTNEFTRRYRAEYIVKDDAGTTQAIMVIDVMPCESHIGQDVIYPLKAVSLQPGLLAGGYRWMIQLARERGIKWMMTSRTEGHDITYRFKELSY